MLQTANRRSLIVAPATNLDTAKKISFRIWFETTFEKRMPLYIQSQEKKTLFEKFSKQCNG